MQFSTLIELILQVSAPALAGFVVIAVGAYREIAAGPTDRDVPFTAILDTLLELANSLPAFIVAYPATLPCRGRDLLAASSG